MQAAQGDLDAVAKDEKLIELQRPRVVCWCSVRGFVDDWLPRFKCRGFVLDTVTCSNLLIERRLKQQHGSQGDLVPTWIGETR